MKSRKFLCCQLRALVLILIGGQSWLLYSIICWISSLCSVYSSCFLIFLVVGVSAGMQLITRTSWAIKDLVNIICSAQCMLWCSVLHKLYFLNTWLSSPASSPATTDCDLITSSTCYLPASDIFSIYSLKSNVAGVSVWPESSWVALCN